MAKTPFKLKSGNNPSFRTMGSSPYKQDASPYEEKEFLDTELGENLNPDGSSTKENLNPDGSPAKDGTYVRLSDPPQYPKHHHEKNKQGRKVAVMDDGWTTDASKQHTRSKGPNPVDLDKIEEYIEKQNKKDRKKPKDQKKKDINVTDELAPEDIEPSSPNKLVEGEWDHLGPKWKDIDWKKAGDELIEGVTKLSKKYGPSVIDYIKGKLKKRKKPKYGKVNDNDYNIKDYEGSENQRKKMEEWEKRTKDQTSPGKHLGEASHPTEAIAAHKGHMMKKKTLKKKKKYGNPDY